MTPDREELLATLRTQTAAWPHLIEPWEAAATGTVRRRYYRFGRIYFEPGDRVLILPSGREDVVTAYSSRAMVPVEIHAARIDLDPEEPSRG